MTIKLSTALYDATISGDTKEVERIQSEIADKIKASKPKVKEAVIDFNTILNNDRASAKSIYDFLNKNLGTDWWELETETIEHLLFIHFAVALEGVNREKIFAIRHLCNSDAAFWDWYEFNQLALAFSGAMADFECLKTPSIGMAINAVKTMNYIRPDREAQFGSSIIRYLCVLIKNEGLYIAPPSIAFIINDKLSSMISEETKKEWPAIMKRFAEFVSNKNVVVEETLVDIQARRLLSAEAAAVAYES